MASAPASSDLEPLDPGLLAVDTGAPCLAAVVIGAILERHGQRDAVAIVPEHGGGVHPTRQDKKHILCHGRQNVVGNDAAILSATSPWCSASP